jgi:hypothetical protein
MVTWLSAGTPGCAGVLANTCCSTVWSAAVGVFPASRSAAAFQNPASVVSAVLCSSSS